MEAYTTNVMSLWVGSDLGLGWGLGHFCFPPCGTLHQEFDLLRIQFDLAAYHPNVLSKVFLHAFFLQYVGKEVLACAWSFRTSF